jgi:acetylornithine/N-succinyldiaminopimelate aminotransferase
VAADTITAQTIAEKDAHYVLGTYKRAPFVLVRGEGMTAVDSEGKEYLDFSSGIAVNALGHCDPELVAAIQQQAEMLGHVCNLYHTVPQAELAEALCEHSFADKVYFCNSGAEAVEAAIKFARKAALVNHGPGKTGLVSFSGGFHGRTGGALAITPREHYQAPFRPLMPGASVAPFNDIDAARAAIGEDTCAVFVEPVQGEGGVHPADPAFLKALREICDETGALLIFDEIQCGLGRTGTLWAHEYTGVKPDMMTLAKSLGGGLPMGATLLTDAVAAVIEPGDHGSTFAAGPVVARAAQVVLARVSDPTMLTHVREMGTYLVEQLKALGNPHVIEVRELGLMVGMEMNVDVLPIVQAAYGQGLIVLNAGPDVLRFLPPLIVQREDIDEMISRLAAVLPA